MTAWTPTAGCAEWMGAIKGRCPALPAKKVDATGRTFCQFHADERGI